MRKQFINLAMVAAVAAVLSSCDIDHKKPGSIYMPDMTYSNALETYSPSMIPNEDGDKVSTRRPVGRYPSHADGYLWMSTSGPMSLSLLLTWRRTISHTIQPNGRRNTIWQRRS